MKYLFLILLFASCTQSAFVAEMDGCEYLVVQTNGHVTAMTHKGNCNNPIHHYEDTTDIEYNPKPYLYGRFNNKDVRMVGR
jgi:hypothetical protein